VGKYRGLSSARKRLVDDRKFSRLKLLRNAFNAGP
jgi:hypothetical protein